MPSDRDTVVTLDNGERITFPAGMSDAQIMSALHKIRTDTKQGTGDVAEAVAKSGFASDFAEKTGKVPIIGPAIQTYLDTNIGAAKSAGQLAVGAARATQMVPGMTTAIDTLAGTPGLAAKSLDAADAYLAPTNTTQTLGKAGADVAQFFLPVPGGSKAKAAVAAKDAGLTYLQTGSVPAALTSAGLSAVLPGAEAAATAAGRLKIGANKTVAQALGATKEWAKSEAAKLAPEMLKRGVKGSREAMLAQAQQKVGVVGDALNQAYDAASAAGHTITAKPIADTIKSARESFHILDPGGDMVAIPGTEGVIAGLKDLETFVKKLGDDIPIAQARHIKQTWDHIVDKAGLFGQNATASATDKAQGWAFREGSGAFRELINASPDIASLNKEASFWLGLKKVLKATELRTQAQSGGLVSNLTGTAGAVTGFSQGDGLGDSVTKAFIGAAVGKKLTQALQSPWWRTTVSAPFKDKLADALMSGSAGKVESAVHAITQAMKAAPGQAQRALSQ